MQTPAQKHRMKKLAAKQQPENENRQDMSGYEMMMAQLYQHKRMLKSIKSVQAKGIKKREILGDYIPYIQGALEADSGNPDEVLMTWLTWAIDAHEIDLALTLAEYGLRHGLKLPDRFQRSIDTVLVEEICDIEIKEPEANLTDLDQMQRLYQMVHKFDMHDQVRSKLHKVMGLKLEEQWPEAALEHLKLAVKFNDRAGVKKDINRIEKAIKESATEAVEKEEKNLDSKES